MKRPPERRCNRLGIKAAVDRRAKNIYNFNKYTSCKELPTLLLIRVAF